MGTRKSYFLLLASCFSLLAFCLSLPSPLRACAMCFSAAAADQHLAKGLFLGMMVMLGAVLGMLGMVGHFIWKVERERRQNMGAAR